MSEFIDDGNVPGHDAVSHASFAELKGKSFVLDGSGAKVWLSEAGNVHTLPRPINALLLATLYGSDDGQVGKYIMVFFDGSLREAYRWLHRNGANAERIVQDGLDYGLNSHGYTVFDNPALPRHKRLQFVLQLYPQQLVPFDVDQARFSHGGLMYVAPAVDREDFDWRAYFRNPEKESAYLNFRDTPLKSIMVSTDTKHRYVDFSLSYDDRAKMPAPTCTQTPDHYTNQNYEGGRIGIRDQVPLILNCWEVGPQEGERRVGKYDGVRYQVVSLAGAAPTYGPENWDDNDRVVVDSVFKNPLATMSFRVLIVTPDSESRSKLGTAEHWKHTTESPGTNAYAEALYADCLLVRDRGLRLRDLPTNLTLEMLSLPDPNAPARPPEVEGSALVVEDDTSPSEGKREWVGFSGLWKRLFG